MTQVIKFDQSKRTKQTAASEPTQTDKDIDALFQILPCDTREEIATKISKHRGRAITEGYIGWLLATLRSNTDKYGWTVPHAARGRMNGSGPRFFHVLVEKGRDPYFDPGREAQLNSGAISTIRHVTSSLENESVALETAASYLKSPSARKWIIRYARRLRSMAEEGNDIAEMFGEDNGSAA